MDSLNSLKHSIETRCNDDKNINTLCIDTCDYNNKICYEKIYNNKITFDDTVSHLNVINDWYNNQDNFNGMNIHSIILRVTGDQKIKMKNGTERNFKANIFNHGFTLINHDGKFIYCDSWEGIHGKKCKQNYTSYEEIFKLIDDVFNPVNVDISNMDNLFNDENKTNWENDAKTLEDIGIETETYNINELIKALLRLSNSDNPYYTNVNKYIQIQVFKPNAYHGGKKRNLNKKTKRKTNKKRNLNKKTKRKTNKKRIRQK
jgi:hypothetical protein